MTAIRKALQAAAGNAGEALYVEDVFSTYLYTGNGSTQSITNGIDLSGEGGLVWIKSRSAATDNQLFDTERTATYELISNSTAAQAADADTLTAFNSNGFSLGADATTNTSAATYASWTFRKAEKFFDVVTYTGTGSPRTVAHNLGSVPGMVIVKRTDSTTGWFCWNRNLANNQIIRLDSTDAAAGPVTIWNNTAPTSTVFSVGNDIEVNASGGTYVAYLFAHDAGGFGDDDESIIKCGSYTTDGSGDATVDLGFEPQIIISKSATTTGDWFIFDNMRGMEATGANTAQKLAANSSAAESTSTTRYININATGFNSRMAVSNTFVYIAIRRPMKTPESGTEVFSANTYTGDGTNSKTFTGVGFPPDLVINNDRARVNTRPWFDRLRGGTQRLTSTATSAEAAVDYGVQAFTTMDGYIGGTQDGATFGFNASGITYENYFIRRATGFFDVVAYRGSNGAVDHSLAVTPELMIIKDRNPGPDPRGYWNVYHKDLGTTHAVFLNSTQTSTLVTDGIGLWKNTSPTDSFFYTGYTNAGYQTGSLGQPYIAYLFATLAGISKVGSYTGTAANLDVDCGFSAGARFILIKRTDSTGDWYVWDSERGIVAGNDPYLLLNSTAAEATTTDYIDPLSSGFTVTSSAPAALNTSGGTYIYLAVS